MSYLLAGAGNAPVRVSPIQSAPLLRTTCRESGIQSTPCIPLGRSWKTRVGGSDDGGYGTSQIPDGPPASDSRIVDPSGEKRTMFGTLRASRANGAGFITHERPLGAALSTMTS